MSWFKRAQKALKSSMALKLSLSVGGILLLSIGFYTYFSIRDMERQMIERMENRMDRFHETLHRATRYSMLKNDREHLLNIIEALGNQEGIMRIRVINKIGTIMFSSMPPETGVTLPWEDLSCRPCHSSPTPLVNVPLSSRVYIEKISQVRTLRMVSPIPNHPSCSTAPCHAHLPTTRILGLFEVAMSLAPVEKEVSSNIQSSIIFNLGLLVFITLLIALYVRFFVARPVIKLLAHSARMAEGDFSQQPPITAIDEIGELARAFSRMGERLRVYTENLEREINMRTSELIKSEVKYHLLFEGTKDTVLMIDDQGKIMDINPAGMELFNQTSKREAMNLEIWSSLLPHGKDRDEFLEILTLRGFIQDRELVVNLVGEAHRTLLITANRLPADKEKVVRYGLLIKDITEQKLSQQRILKEMKTIEGILEGSPIAQFVVDRNHHIIHWNKACEQLTGRKARDMVGTQLQWKAFYPHPRPIMCDLIIEENLQALNQYYGEKTLRKSPLIEGGYQAEDFFTHLGDGGRHLFFLAAPIRDPEGMIQAVITTLQDVTEQKRAEAVIQRNIQEIQHAYEELKDTQEQLIQSARLASLGKLAATIAHEINNPIAGVLTYTKLIGKILTNPNLGREKLEEIKKHIAIMEAETARCGDIVKNLLAFARGSVVSIGEAPVHDILERSLAIIRHQIELSQVTVEMDYDRDLPLISCNARQLQQAFMNIILNAVEAMAGGGTLTLRTRRLKDGQGVEIRITDTGHGIAEEHLPQLFEPFFSTKPEGKGVGLGLSVSYGIIKNHQGEIIVKSKINQGTQFLIRLPVKGIAAQPPNEEDKKEGDRL